MKVWKEHFFFDEKKGEFTYHIDLFLEEGDKIIISVLKKGKELELIKIGPQRKIHLELKWQKDTKGLKDL